MAPQPVTGIADFGEVVYAGVSQFFFIFYLECIFPQPTSVHLATNLTDLRANPKLYYDIERKKVEIDNKQNISSKVETE